VIHRLRTSFIPDRLLGGFAVLAGGTAVSQAISMLAAPVLARLYSPADFGRLGLLLSFVNVPLLPPACASKSPS